ncbi:MAG: T9SS type A sorting domain-containing protein [Saprospiraceae bacterium]|nr:T9SS type A sorting domain-containing protein [Saprospiraceae bacterium]MCF8248611.1 T9SS type A sorting domain-containing protein [Saprospiraceae bacterium]MCF8281049.1 T9SS type A sorting domain-containing protein [Bacteroidales bacterium]MCF8310344.1 T9SS type A sorting domain-containing protein [Saprospiraceae bacterium]MCF8442075.1 T9SS type A sorting domain-containing protein [Saprospiraceae bacterium]
MLLAILMLPLVNSNATNPTDKTCLACDNVVNGGTIQSDEFGCPNPTWDPSLITSVTLPTGGSGNLEFLWIFTTNDPTLPLSQWTPIPGTNSPNYDPGPISITTHYRRCARRSGCSDYVGETNIVTKEALCCDNVTDGGTIGISQVACLAPYDPALLTSITSPSGGSNVLEYQWVISSTGTPYTPTNPDWVFIAGANSETFDPAIISQTTYYIRLARRHGCLVYDGVSNMITVAISDNLAATAVADSVTCFGGNDGSIDLTPTGGTTPYTYAWSGGLGSSADPQNVIPGNYSVTVTDANGCATTTSATVGDGDQITLTASATHEICDGAENGTATLTSTTGGQAPYSMVWSTTPAQTASQIIDLAPATYTVTVTDAQGCTATASATVNAGPALAITLFSTNVICFGKNQGSAMVDAVANGSGSYTYLWNDAASQTSQSIANLFAGNYTVTVTDDQGCAGSATAIIADGPQIFVNPSHTNATCNYTTDGSATVTVSGGVSPYSYLWDDVAAQTTATADALAAGIYHVTITDASGCTTSSTATVEAPISAEITTSGSNVSCFNGLDGVVSVSVTNGSPANYNYTWNDPNSSNTASVSGLSAGTYGVTVTDNNGCLVTASVSITQPTQLVISMASTDATCGNGSDGSATVTAGGGTPGYDYAWSLPASPNAPVLNNAPAGTYSVTVTDDNGCSAIGTSTIGAPPVLTANLIVANVTCNGLNDGQMSVVAGGGVGPYTFAWNSPGAPSGTSISGLSPGNYGVTVTDAVGCTATASGTVTEPATLTVSFQKNDVICVDATNGSAIAIPAGGTAPYAYLWAGGQTTANISNLATGFYQVTVIDNHFCQVAGTVQIISTTTLNLSTTTVPANCFNSNDGTATAIATGGTAPITYLWSNGATTASNAGIYAGNYSVTVSDADGCVLSKDAIVASPPQLTGPASLVSAVTTYGGSNGSIKVTPGGGTAPYTVLWNNASSATTVTGLTAGTYSVTTTDAHNCTVSSTITLVNPSKVGDYVWHDLNQNGIQETGEPGLDSVKLHLIGATSTGVQIHLTTYSDSTGFYAFDGLAAGVYQVKVDLPAIHVFSPMNVGSDFTDSDINQADSSTAVFNLAVNHYDNFWDVGLIELDEKINIGDFVWQDADHDGIQDIQEQGIANYTVRLYSMPSNTLLATRTTNAIGKYLFTDVYPGLYQIEFVLGNLPNGSVYSPPNQGSNDNIDSDPDPATGRTATFQVFPYTVDNLTIDAGVFKECDNITDGGLVGYNENLCGNGADPAEIVNLTSPSGGFGVLEYLWLKSTMPVYNGPGDPNWMMIQNSNSANYNPGPIFQTTYYIRCARRAGCPDYPGESNIVSKTITPNPLAQIIDHPNVICKDVGGRFEAAIAGGGATYAWDFGADATPATAASRVVNPVSWSTEGIKTVSLTVTRFGCSVTVTVTVAVNTCGSPIIIIFDDVFAELNGAAVNLRWHATGFEPNNTVFRVQRSENGNDYENLNAMAGTDCDADGIFHFIDSRPKLGENFYRIEYRQSGENASQGLSNTTNIFNKPAGVLPIQLYPNPTSGLVTVEFVKLSSNSSTIQVNDAFGRVIFESQVPEMTEKTELDLSQLPLGLYWVRITSENVREQVVKVVKSE